MKIANYFIDRPVLSSVLSLFIIFSGLFSISNLPIESVPNIAPPTIEVVAVYPGANAEIVEKSVTTPLERQINSVPGLDYLLSNSSSNGVSTIRAVFESNTDVAANQVNVLNSVQTAMAELPEEVSAQGATVKESELSYLQVYNIEMSDKSYDRNYLNGFYDLAISDSLTNLKGVGQVILLGGSKPAYRLWLDPQKLKRYDLVVADIVESLEHQNQNLKGGIIGGPPFSSDVNTTIPFLIDGNLEGIEELSQLIVKTGGNSPGKKSMSDGDEIVYLSDVGYVEYSLESISEQSIDSSNGTPSLSFGIIRQPGYNTVNTSKRIDDYISKVSSDLPPGIVIQKIFDQADFVKSSLDSAQKSLRDAAILVILVIFIFLQDWRSTLIPLIALPVSLLGAVALTKFFSFDLDSLTLIGFGLATGLVVDDAIIVVEAISAKIDAGDDPKNAAKKAMEELESPIIATAFALIAVFLPAILVSGPTGIIFKGISLTIIFCIVVSTFNAITGKPLQCSILLKKEKSTFSRPHSAQICGVIGLLAGLLSYQIFPILIYATIGVLIGWYQQSIFNLINRFVAKVSRDYDIALRQFMMKSRLTLSIISASIIIMVIFVGYYPKSFIPDQDQGYGLGIIQLSGDASLQATMNVANQAQKIIANEPEIVDGALVGGTGFHGSSPNQGVFFFGLKPFNERTKSSQKASIILEKLNQQFKSIPNANVLAVQPPAVPGFSVEGGIHSYLVDESNRGYSFNDLSAIAYSFIKRNQEDHQFSSIETPSDLHLNALRLAPDRRKMASLNIDYKAAMNEVSALYGGSFVNNTYENGQYRQIYVQAQSSQTELQNSLNEIYISSREGNLVPLSEVVEIKRVDSPNVINHFNLKRAIPIQAQPSPLTSNGQAINKLQSNFRELDFSRISQNWAGLGRTEVQAKSLLINILAAGLVMAYLILCIQFNSFIDPIILISSIPIAFTSSFLFLAANKIDLNVFAEFAFISLISLVAKNGILIIALANQYRDKGLQLADAIQQAASRRLRPILMTSVAALAGFFPLMSATGAGGLAQRSIGTVLFGGYLIASLTSLFVVPTLYLVLKRRFSTTTP